MNNERHNMDSQPLAWYRMDARQARTELSSSEEGLSEQEAVNRLRRYGPNALTDEQQISIIKVALHQFTSPLIYLLLIAALITFLLGEYIDTGVIMAVVVINAIIGFMQELKAEENVRSLKNWWWQRPGSSVTVMRRRLMLPNWFPATWCCWLPGSVCRPTCDLCRLTS